MGILEKKYGQWLFFWILAFIWGTSFILIKKGIEVFPPDIVGTLRIAFTFFFFLPFALKNLHKITRHNIKSLLIVGFIGNLFPAILFSIAETRLPSALAGMLNATTPIFTWIVGISLYRSRTHPLALLGIAIGFIGTIGLMVTDINHIFRGWNLYGLFVLLATFFYGVNTNELKHKLHDLDALSIASLGFFLSGPFAIVYLLFRRFPMAYTALPNFTNGLLAVMLLAFLGSFLALILFNNFVKYTSAVFAASITYVIPIFALMWGLMDGETIAPHHLIAMIIIITGVYLVNNDNIKPQKIIVKQNSLKS